MRLRRRADQIPKDERDWWHAETWEEAAKALRDYYPMGCALDFCSAAPERGSHFCERHAGFMDRVAKLETAARNYFREFDHLIDQDYPERRALREALGAKRVERQRFYGKEEQL